MADAPHPPVQESARGWPVHLRRKPPALLLLALAFFGAALIVRAGRDEPAASASSPADPETVTLAPRDFVRVVRLTGSTEATRSHVVSVPLLAGSTRGSLTITHLARSGTVVAPGDLLVAFDAQHQQKLALDREMEYRDLLEQIARKQAEQDAARVKDASSLARAEHAVQHHELEVLKNEMLSKIEAEKNLQQLDEARATLAALRDNDALTREAARAELRILEIRRDRARAAMEHASRNVAAMSVRSPLDGVVVTKQRWRGNGIGDVQEGDDLWPGAPVLEVVNQTAMRVRAKINQADLALLSPGQRVTVRFDAYPDLTLPGRLDQMAPIATPGSFSNRVRTFTALVAIDGTNPRLLPDLTTAVDVEVERVSGALVVPREAILQTNGTARVRVRQDGGAREREVTLGASNEVEAVVMRGLEPGAVVLRRWP